MSAEARDASCNPATRRVPARAGLVVVALHSVTPGAYGPAPSPYPSYPQPPAYTPAY